MKTIRSRPALVMALALLLVGCAAPAAAPSGAPTSISGAAACSLSALTGAADWQRPAAALEGTLTLTNYTGAPCALSGSPRVSLRGAAGETFPIEQQALDGEEAPAAVTLDANDSATIRLAWSNWCGEPPAEGITLRLELAGHPGAAEVTLQDPNGQPRREVPGCAAPDAPSILRVAAILPAD